MKKSLMAGILPVMAQCAHAQNDNQEMMQMLPEAGEQGLCSALRRTLPENSTDMKLGPDDLENLVSCACFDEQQARRSARMKPESFDAWAARRPALTNKDLPDSAWLSTYNTFSRNLPDFNMDSKLTGKKIDKLRNACRRAPD